MHSVAQMRVLVIFAKFYYDCNDVVDDLLQTMLEIVFQNVCIFLLVSGQGWHLKAVEKQ
jgi:hypothetical protein